MICNGIEINVLRGKEKIGENLIEIKDRDTKILLECGVALSPTEKSRLIENEVAKAPYDAVIITHSHKDHAGLLSIPINSRKIYMGKPTCDILLAQGEICKENQDKIEHIFSNRSFLLGSLEIVPHLCDHSAYDSYMIEIRRKETVVLYTGDFRSNGRKSYERLLSFLPTNIDVLITEATNQRKKEQTEIALEDIATDEIKNHKITFVLQSRTNADRVVSIYKASRRAKKPLFMPTTMADLVSLCPGIPNPKQYSGIYPYMPYKINESTIKRQNFVMLIYSSMTKYLEKIDKITPLRNCLLIYSMWQGYKRESKSIKELLSSAKRLGIRVICLHVSGHADKQAQKMLIEKTRPKKIITVHSDK